MLPSAVEQRDECGRATVPQLQMTDHQPEKSRLMNGTAEVHRALSTAAHYTGLLLLLTAAS